MLIIMKEFQCIVNKSNARIHWMSSIYPSNWFASSATRKRSRKPINMFDVAVLLYNLIKIILRILKARAKNCNVHFFFFLFVFGLFNLQVLMMRREVVTI